MAEAVVRGHDARRAQLGRLVLRADPQVDGRLVRAPSAAPTSSVTRCSSIRITSFIAEMSSNPAALQQARGAVDVERVLDGVGQAARTRARQLPGRSARAPTAPGRRAGCASVSAPRSVPAQALVQVARGPVGEPGVDRLVEREGALGDRPGRRDHDHQRDLRLEQQHLDVLDRRGVQTAARRRRPAGRSPGTASRWSRASPVDLAAHGGQLELEAGTGAGSGASRSTDVRVQAVARVGRHPARRRCAGGSGSPSSSSAASS